MCRRLRWCLSLCRHLVRERDALIKDGFAEELSSSLALSGTLALSKAVRGRLGGNPRRQENRAVGLLVVPAIAVVEEAWLRAVHLVAAARCHKWGRTGAHRTPIPAWRNPPHPTPSRLVYEFRTAVSLDAVLQLRDITKACALSIGADAPIDRCLCSVQWLRQVLICSRLCRRASRVWELHPPMSPCSRGHRELQSSRSGVTSSGTRWLSTGQQALRQGSGDASWQQGEPI